MRRNTFHLLLILSLLYCSDYKCYAQNLYEKITSIDDINPNDVYVIVNNQSEKVLGIIDSGKGQTINCTSYNNQKFVSITVENSDEYPYEIKINETDKGYTLQTEQGYIIYAETNTDFRSREEPRNNKADYWSINFTPTNNSGCGYAKIMNNANISSDKNRYIDYYSKGNYFAVYKDSYNVYLYRKLSSARSVSVKIGAPKYATLYYSSKNLVVPEGVTAYTFCNTDNNLIVSKTYNTNDIIPKNTAVVLNGKPATYIFMETVQKETGDENNTLQGTDDNYLISDTDADNYFYYMLSLNKEQELSSVGFYWGNSTGSPFENGAHKAYLRMNKTTTDNAKEAFIFSDILQETTNITDSPSWIAKPRSNAYYTIQGIRITSPAKKGVYIMNGKKVIIK